MCKIHSSYYFTHIDVSVLTHLH